MRLTNPEAGRSFSYMAARQQASWLLFLYLATGMASASAQTGNAVPTVETIVTRMAQARAGNRARFRPYIVTRDYKLFGKDESKAKSEVVADVAFVPPDSKTYTIQGTDGSRLGKMIVRRMLASEADVTKDYASTDISADNYDFRFVRAEEVSGQRCYVLAVLPRRNDKRLLRGNIWVDANTYLLRRFDGTLAKNPSWWVRDVRITLVYGDAGGMWLQTASEATANVRILGRSTMVSHDVKYEITELVAAGPSGKTSFLSPMPGRSLRRPAIPRPPK
jgi:outer membrane lipoprotein-sorting protein